MTTFGGAAGVGRATTNSVVICYATILLVNFVITVWLNAYYHCYKEFISGLF
jgi:phospholipid/cholesterol/gamma-HCH transport system permease protein